ncbi:MAG: tetratricopeptide repeat protein [Methanofollis sp.]|uniref:tetratricopeptide repeat protein n=1 Tax=Methanofollis sp. TaxID=2052835 RepID=UPI002631072A|nr:tetratricopeptide repeat protein [Methanofollis sp.]MDD4254411.1 tetratricopeptide repeat protein [Methanofollis sp.]
MAKTSGSSADTRTVTRRDPLVEITLHQANEKKYRSEYAKAIEIYDRVLEIDPKHARAFHSKGNVLDMLGRYEEAISCYDLALTYDPNNAETLYNKGVTLSKMRCQSEGIECIEQGVSLALGTQ